MVRALAGDSTMTRFLGTGGSVALGPYPTLFRPRGSAAGNPRRSRGRPRLRGPAAGATGSSSPSVVDGHRGVAARDRARRDLHEPDVEVREEEDRLDLVDEDRPLAVHHPQVRAAQPDVARGRRLVEVGEQRLLVVEMQDDVADHARMVAPARRRCQPADGPVRGGRSRPRGGPARRRPRRRSRPGCTPGSSGSRSGRRCTTSRSGRRGASPGRPPWRHRSGSRCSRPSGSSSSRRGGGDRRGCRR